MGILTSLAFGGAKMAAKGAAYAGMYTAMGAGKAAWGTAKLGYSAATSKPGKAAFAGANLASKGILGASIPQIAATSGIGLGAYAYLSDDPVGGLYSAGQSAGSFLQSMGEQMRSRPSYGHTSFQQSVQGLVFGLHSSRTR